MKRLVAILIAATFTGLAVFYFPVSELDAKSEFRNYINNHPYFVRERLDPDSIKKIPKFFRPDLAYEQEFLSTLNPQLGRPTPENLWSIHDSVSAYQFSESTPGSSSSPWIERGPNNVAGRVRALAWDPNDATGKKVWAGGVTGGLWYNNDITSSSSVWVAVSDFWDNISVTAIAFDPTNSNTIYVGTGEGWGIGFSGARGAGIWKSTNGGLSWTRLASTNDFFYINDLVVRNEAGVGVVYAAVDGNFNNGVWHGLNTMGLQRSSNGGVSWNQVMPLIPAMSHHYLVSDLEVGPNNRLWVGTKRTPYNISNRGGGTILYSDNGVSWVTAFSNPSSLSNSRRVELAVAPSNHNVVYAMIENNAAVEHIIRTTNGGVAWTFLNKPIDHDLGIPATDFSRGQAWYDLILAVVPNNPNAVIAGAINAHMTTNGGLSWNQISKWSNNPNMGTQPYSYIHADHHQIVFKPGSSTELIFGTDGGVSWTNNLPNAATSSVFENRNNGLNITQFYAGAIHPAFGSNQMLAGSQDNGTQRFLFNNIGPTSMATSGDGAYCFIDQTNPNFQITSYVYNSYFRSVNGGVSFPSTMQWDLSTGMFINPAGYDNIQNILFSAKTLNTINRIRNVETTPIIDDFTVSGMNAMASHFCVSPFTTSSTTLFVGTTAGDLFKVTNANTANPIAVSIGNALPPGYVSCVALEASENQLLVTLKNYGVNSVWYSNNGGQTWVSKEGNLPDMPIRWALFNPNNFNEVLLATEVGVWATQNFNASTPVWVPSNSGLAHVRVDQLQIRASDKRVMAITHGRGVFTSDAFYIPPHPVANFTASNTSPCRNETVTLTDISTNTPTNWTWSFAPPTVSFQNGTSNASQHPQVRFSQSGSYSITLVATNASGSDTIVKNAYVTVQDSVFASVSVSASDTSICFGGSITFSANAVNAGVNPNYQWKINGFNVGANSTVFTTSTLANADLVTVEVTNMGACQPASSIQSTPIGITVKSLPVVSITASKTGVLCESDTANLIGTPIGGVFFGTNGVVGNQFVAALAGQGSHMVYYQYTDTDGCENMDSLPLYVQVIPMPTIDILGSVLRCQQIGYNYQWYRDSVPIVGANQIELPITLNGRYQVEISNNGCSMISAVMEINTISLQNFQSLSRTSIYPNPTNNFTKVAFFSQHNGNVLFQLLSSNGQLIQNSNWKTIYGDNEFEVDCSQLSRGLYFIVLDDGQQQSVFKLDVF
ncbi:MAG: T9SS type A sorting domain-containing protein [Schleiferiaceae bacterium]|nr:T9SS type A sorting domain-containing protein [Schleiferiaceae bacterium]